MTDTLISHEVSISYHCKDMFVQDVYLETPLCSQQLQYQRHRRIIDFAKDLKKLLGYPEPIWGMYVESVIYRYLLKDCVEYHLKERLDRLHDSFPNFSTLDDVRALDILDPKRVCVMWDVGNYFDRLIHQKSIQGHIACRKSNKLVVKLKDLTKTMESMKSLYWIQWNRGYADIGLREDGIRYYPEKFECAFCFNRDRNGQKTFIWKQDDQDVNSRRKGCETLKFVQKGTNWTNLLDQKVIQEVNSSIKKLVIECWNSIDLAIDYFKEHMVAPLCISNRAKQNLLIGID